MRIENNLNRHATYIHNLCLNTIILYLVGHLFGSDGFEDLDYVLNKAAEISIRVLSFFFVISAGFFHCEPFIFSAESGIDEH